MSSTQAGGDLQHDTINGIVWIASYPKSGNTWARVFLHNLLAILDGRGDKAVDINEINEFTHWDLSAQRYERYIGRPPNEVDRKEIAAARPKVQAEIADLTRGAALVKTHHALVMDRGVPTINLDVSSGAVYVVRNPLDVAISFAHHQGTSLDDTIDLMGRDNVETAVTDTNVYEVYGSWSQHVESWTRRAHRAFHIMRYEDMLAEPVMAFGALARHLRLEPNMVQLIEAVDRSSFKQLSAQEARHGFAEKPESADKFFRVGKAGQWRKGLSRRQIRRVLERHGPMMAKFGYISGDISHLAHSIPKAP